MGDLIKPSARVVRPSYYALPNTGQLSLDLQPPPHNSNPPKKLPIHRDLLEHLQEAFPDRLNLVSSMGSLEAAKGARRVVDYLSALLERQSKDIN